MLCKRMELRKCENVQLLMLSTIQTYILLKCFVFLLTFNAYPGQFILSSITQFCELLLSCSSSSSLHRHNFRSLRTICVSGERIQLIVEFLHKVSYLPLHKCHIIWSLASIGCELFKGSTDMPISSTDVQTDARRILPACEFSSVFKTIESKINQSNKRCG